jgi:hypothetical protein
VIDQNQGASAHACPHNARPVGRNVSGISQSCDGRQFTGTYFRPAWLELWPGGGGKSPVAPVRNRECCKWRILLFCLRTDPSEFDPDIIRILSDALDDAWKSLQTSGATFHLGWQADQTREILARCIIEVAKLGELNQRKLRDAALAHLAEARVRHAWN